MADKGHQGHVDTEEERRHERGKASGHSAEERGTAHEFNEEDAGRRERHAHSTMPASTGRSDANGGAEDAGDATERARKTRGGTHDQHVTAGKKGGSRIRELIELGYKYEREHGIGPGQNERSKLAAKRRATKTGDGPDEDLNE